MRAEIQRRGLGGRPAKSAPGPLPFGQVAPLGFLLVEKAAVALAAAGDYALRLLPLAASLVALVLFFLLAVRLLVRPASIALALALFALQPELIRYAAQVKPYAVDLAVALSSSRTPRSWCWPGSRSGSSSPPSSLAIAASWRRPRSQSASGCSAAVRPWCWRRGR